MGSIQVNMKMLIKISLLGVLNKMGSIPFIIDDSQYLSLLGVLNKMGSIPHGIK